MKMRTFLKRVPPPVVDVFDRWARGSRETMSVRKEHECHSGHLRGAPSTLHSCLARPPHGSIFPTKAAKTERKEKKQARCQPRLASPKNRRKKCGIVRDSLCARLPTKAGHGVQKLSSVTDHTTYRGNTKGLVKPMSPSCTVRAVSALARGGRVSGGRNEGPLERLAVLPLLSSRRGGRRSKSFRTTLNPQEGKAANSPARSKHAFPRLVYTRTY